MKSEGSGYEDTNVPFWRTYFGQNVIYTDPTVLAETIALTIGIAEGTIDLTEGEDHLAELGISSKAVESVSTALAEVSKSSSGGIATIEGDVDIEDNTGSIERL